MIIKRFEHVTPLGGKEPHPAGLIADCGKSDLEMHDHTDIPANA